MDGTEWKGAGWEEQRGKGREKRHMGEGQLRLRAFWRIILKPNTGETFYNTYTYKGDLSETANNWEDSPNWKFAIIK